MRHFKSRLMTHSWLALMGLGLVTCGGGEAPMPEAEMEKEAEPAASAVPVSSDPRVFFVAPEDGEMFLVDNPVVFEFGIENYDLTAVPEEVDQPRPAVGHHHLGVNTECLPPGEVIPQADPWVHFGDASTTIEMMLEPGEHTFVLQLGDDEHRTQPQDGLCETVTIRVEEGV